MKFIKLPHKQPTDHLKIKQQAQIMVNIFTDKNPHEMLLYNSSYSLNNYVDCVEAVRILGMLNLESMAFLEQMDYEIEMDDAFAYYLKVQLMIVNTKVAYYGTKSQSILNIYKKSQGHVMELLKIMNIFKLLNLLLHVKNPNNIVLMTIRAMKNYLSSIAQKSIETQPFKLAIETLKPKILKVIEICRKVKAQPSPEICEFCEELIEENELACSQNHQMKRCSITNLLIDLNCKNFCTQCLVSVTTLDILTNLFDNSSDYYFCPFCDGPLNFFE